MHRKFILAFALGLNLAAVAPASATEAMQAEMPAAGEEETAQATQVVMHKSPGCGCCAVWAEHLHAHGFEVESVADPNISELKASLGIPPSARSCHTAMVDRYVIEGHVPAADIIRLLKEKPDDVQGLTVPGMPLGSPGMEHPRPEYYETLVLMKDGSMRVYASHEPGEDYSPVTRDSEDPE